MRPAEVLALVGFILALVVVGPRHEPWFDEAQAWLIARDASPSEIVSTLARQEGSPALWHGLLWGVQRLGLPYPLFWTVSGALGVCGVSLVLFASALPRGARLGFAASFFALYQFSVVARSYALDVALVPLVSVMFAARLRRPMAFGLVLALLANANAFSILIAGCFAAEFGWRVLRSAEGRTTGRRWAGVALSGVGLVLALAQILPRPAAGMMACCDVRPDVFRPLVLLGEAFADPSPLGEGVVGAGAMLALVLTVAVMVAFAILWRAAGLGWLALGLFASQATLAAATEGHLGHAGLFFLTAICLLGIAWPSLASLGRRAHAAVLAGLTIMLAQLDLNNLEACARDVLEPYSGSRAAAVFLERLQATFPDRTSAAAGFKTFAVQPYLARNAFANGRTAQGGAYFRWTRAFGVPRTGGPGAVAEVAPGRFDAIVASDDDGAGHGSAAQLIHAAARMGYLPLAVFPGAMIWKARRIQKDDLVVFGRADEDWSALARPRR